jgi:hypothetical protein
MRNIALREWKHTARRGARASSTGCYAASYLAFIDQNAVGKQLGSMPMGSGGQRTSSSTRNSQVKAARAGIVLFVNAAKLLRATLRHRLSALFRSAVGSHCRHQLLRRARCPWKKRPPIRSSTIIPSCARFKHQRIEARIDHHQPRQLVRYNGRTTTKDSGKWR